MKIVERLTEYLSQQELDQLFNEAEKLRQDSNQHEILMHHIDAAYIATVQGDRDFLSEFIDRNGHEKEATTYHEIGHAFINIYNQNNLILHIINNQGRKIAGGAITLHNAYSSINMTPPDEQFIPSEELLKIIDMVEAGIITQQIFKRPSPSDPQSYLFAGRMLKNKDEILQFLSNQGGSDDIQKARMIAGLVIQRDKTNRYESLDDDQKKSIIDEILIKRYKKTFQTIANNKDKIQKGVDLMLSPNQATGRSIISGNELYNLWKIDKPLYDFEEGPLPKNLQHHYRYRGQ